MSVVNDNWKMDLLSQQSSDFGEIIGNVCRNRLTKLLYGYVQQPFCLEQRDRQVILWNADSCVHLVSFFRNVNDAPNTTRIIPDLRNSFAFLVDSTNENSDNGYGNSYHSDNSKMIIINENCGYNVYLCEKKQWLLRRNIDTIRFSARNDRAQLINNNLLLVSSVMDIFLYDLSDLANPIEIHRYTVPCHYPKFFKHGMCIVNVGFQHQNDNENHSNYSGGSSDYDNYGSNYNRNKIRKIRRNFNDSNDNEDENRNSNSNSSVSGNGSKKVSFIRFVMFGGYHNEPFLNGFFEFEMNFNCQESRYDSTPHNSFNGIETTCTRLENISFLNCKQYRHVYSFGYEMVRNELNQRIIIIVGGIIEAQSILLYNYDTRTITQPPIVKLLGAQMVLSWNDCSTTNIVLMCLYIFVFFHDIY